MPSESNGSMPGWVLKQWPIIAIAATGLAWGARLEERTSSHLSRPYHDGMQSSRDDLIQIKAELRFLREDILELKQSLAPGGGT
jgi:hypothetical protein